MTEIRIAYPEDTLQRIANYLGTRPYAEVFSLIGEIQTRGVKVESALKPALKPADQSPNYADDEHSLS